MTRSLRVEFLPSDLVAGVAPETQVHDISLPDSVVGIPEILENPHVDFPGTWSLVANDGGGDDGAARYQQVERVAETSDTAAG